MLVTALALLMTADNGRGSTLYRDCKAAIAIIDATAKESSDASFSAGRCIGFFNGFTSVKSTDARICTSDASTGTMIRVYIFFMDRNPKLMDSPEGAGALLALREAYPCLK